MNSEGSIDDDGDGGGDGRAKEKGTWEGEVYGYMGEELS